MPVLPENASLAQFQAYVHALEEERGFADDPTLQKCLLLGEEIGELFKAIRKAEKMKMDPSTTFSGSVEEELADVLIYLLAIANRYQINLERAFRKKEEQNKQRQWRS